MRASTVDASVNMRWNSSAPSYSFVPAARSNVRLKGFDMASEYTAAPCAVASSTKRLALSHPAVGASTLERAPSPWMITAMRGAAGGGDEAFELSGRREPARYGTIGRIEVRRRVRRREPRRAMGHRIGDDGLHGRDLVVGRFPLLARVTHHVPAHGAMPDVEGGVHADAAVERSQVLGKRLESVEGDALER